MTTMVNAPKSKANPLVHIPFLFSDSLNSPCPHVLAWLEVSALTSFSSFYILFSFLTPFSHCVGNDNANSSFRIFELVTNTASVAK